MIQAPKIKITLALLSLPVLFTTSIVWQCVTIAVLLVLAFARLRELKNLKFWLVFLLLAFVPCLFIQTYQIFLLSCLVLCRSLIVYLALITLAENIDLNTLHKNLPKIIGKRLALIVVLAFNLSPMIRNIILRNYALFYFKKAPNISSLKRATAYVLVVFRQVINAADCCAENMFLSYVVNFPKITLITGAKHCGKTTQAAALVEAFKSKNWSVSGILAPSTMENDRRTTIYVMDIKTGDRKLLASRNNIINDVSYTYGGFSFSRSGYDFATHALANYQPGDIVFLDEFGPLEFANMGHAEDLKKLLQANIAALYIVIREELVERFRTEFPQLVFDVIEVKNIPHHQPATATVENAAIFSLDK